MEESEIKEFVKERYSKIATKEESYCSCCGGSGNILEEAQKQVKAMGYSEKEIRSIPLDAVYGLGCGNPAALAEINTG
jgi:tRNA A37 threonylcarbamoyladenosine synthetase subunit TsaC/SUA5/YrdC